MIVAVALVRVLYPDIADVAAETVLPHPSQKLDR